MSTIVSDIKALIAEAKRAQEPGFFPEKGEEFFAIPGLIDAGNGKSILASREMEKLISMISSGFKHTDPVLARSHTDKEWNRIVRGALGPVLAQIDLEDNSDANARAVLEAVQVALANQKTANRPREFAFGCTLFENPDVAPFDIGAVRFEPRITWLERKKSEGDVTEVTARRVERIWRDGNVGKRKVGSDSVWERGILDAIGACPYVCSVRTVGLAPEAGRLKAQAAARLAMTSIALRWHNASTALDGLNLLVDRSARVQCTLSFIPGTISLASSHRQGLPHGPSISPQDWVEVLTQHKVEYDTVAEIIEYYMSPTGQVSRPKLMNALAQALLWFHEGCREQVDVIAVVKFAATLDALAGGRGSGGIKSLINARLGLSDNDAIRAGGQTVKQAVEEIYGEGRSRTIHGTSNRLGHDWASTRTFSEHLARHCLVACLHWAGNNKLDDLALMKK